VKRFGSLFRMIADKAKALLADPGYDVEAIREEIAFHGVQAVIPTKRGRRNPALHDRDKYRQRSRVEQLFNKLKNWRRVATRYEQNQRMLSRLRQPRLILAVGALCHET